MSSNTFLTADLHMGHDAVRYHSNRPFATLEAMNEALIENWNKAVKTGDTVYIIGDFAWRDHAHYLQALRGKKILITGTHDKMPRKVMDQFTQVIGDRHQPGILEVVIDGQPCCLCHYPLSTWNSSCHGSWHFHGHSHGSIEEQPDYLRCDVGVDIWHYAPVPWEVLKAKLSARVEAWKERRKALGDGPLISDRIDALKLENLEWRLRCQT